MKQTNKAKFWKAESKPNLHPRCNKLELPVSKLDDYDYQKLVKTGIGITMAGVALGVGTKAFKEAMED